MKRRLLNLAAFLVAGMVIAAAVVTPVYLIERNDRKRLRAAAYRLCERENLSRAELHSQAQHTELLRNRLPVMRCSPNLEGKAATPLTHEAQVRFVRRYRAGLIDPTP